MTSTKQGVTFSGFIPLRRFLPDSGGPAFRPPHFFVVDGIPSPILMFGLTLWHFRQLRDVACNGNAMS